MSNVTLGKVAILKRETFYVDEVEVAWIPGYEERYAISKDGQVWSAGKAKRGIGATPRWLKPGLGKRGYLTVHLLGKTRTIHRLMGITWIYNPDKIHRTEVDHEFREKTDNTVYHLRWLTKWENDINRQSNKGIEDGTGKNLEKHREADKRYRDNMSEEKKEAKKKKDREREQAKRDARTPEQKAADNEAAKLRQREKRAAETPEQRRARLDRRNELERAKRAAKKAEAGE